jgi:DNA sulfur modification protein DndB
VAQIQPTISLPALRGRMGTRDYYVLLLPLNQVARFLYVPDGSRLPAEFRAQRKLNEKRVPEIARYILENEEDWLFSSLTASFEGEVAFTALRDNPDMGTLHIPLNARLLVNDGQHRRAAIDRALREDPTLGNQTISIVLFPGESLDRNQQMFSDLNRTVQRTPRSLNIMYDHRDPLNEITLMLESRVPLLQGRVEKDMQSIAVRSARLITLSSLYDMASEALGRDVPESASRSELQKSEDFLVDAWGRLTVALPQWSAIQQGELTPAQARPEFINVHAVFYFAIGKVVRLAADAPDKWSALTRLREIDWRRTNREWQGICMLGPDIVTRKQTRTALAEHILWRVGLRTSKPEPAFRLEES